MRARPLALLLALAACNVGFETASVSGSGSVGGTVTPDESAVPDDSDEPLRCALASGTWDITLTATADGCGFGTEPLSYTGTLDCGEDGSFSLVLSGESLDALSLACTSDVSDFSCAWAGDDQSLSLVGSSASGTTGGANWSWSVGSCTSTGTAALVQR